MALHTRPRPQDTVPADDAVEDTAVLLREGGREGGGREGGREGREGGREGGRER